MRLKTPGDLQAAIGALGSLSRELATCLDTSGNDSRKASEAWLRWWAGADMKLRALFVDDDLLVPLARTAAEIRNLDIPAPAFQAPTLSFMCRERDVWVDRLDAAVLHLQRLKDFVMRPGRVAVLDTSAFQEFDRFWEADWAEVTEADASSEGMPEMPIRLVVPLIVVEELDGQKRHSNARVRKTAREVLRRLRGLARESTNSLVDVLRLDQRVTVEILLDDLSHVRMPVNDAEIIDRAVHVRSLFPSVRRVILVTGDVSMGFRAEGAGLETRHVARCTGEDEKAPES